MDPSPNTSTGGEALERTNAVAAAKESTWGADLRDIAHLAAPAILQLSFQQAVIVTNQSMAGHLGPDELAAAAIAVTWFNLMWFFIIGASSALDTLASQAFGAGNRAEVLQWAVSSAAVLSMMAVPMAAALFFADSVAGVVFRQPPHICELVGTYCRGILPGLWPFIWSLIIMKAMQAQNMMWGPTLVTIGMFVGNIFINLGLIKLYGFTGAAYAQSASRIALFLFLLLQITTFGRGCMRLDESVDSSDESADCMRAAAHPSAASTAHAPGVAADPLAAPLLSDSEAGMLVKRAPSGGDREHMSVWHIVREGFSAARLSFFLQLGIAGGLMMAADASSFDITTAMAGFIGVEEVGAHTSLLTIIEFICTSFPYGIATAATIRVGNMLGAGRATSARQSAWLCLAGCAVFSVTVMILFFVFGGYVGRIFTNDPQVVALVAKLSVFGGLYQIPDCVYGSVSGILRGTGRQASLMWTNLAGFWGVGMPLCYLLAFRFGYGVEGLWIGLVTGLSCSALLVMAMMLLLDWEAEAEKAQQASLLLDAPATPDDIADDSGDMFPPEALPRDGHAGPAPGSPHRMRRSRSLPVAVARRAASQPQLSAGSLTGSYVRLMNSHL